MLRTIQCCGVELELVVRTYCALGDPSTNEARFWTSALVDTRGRGCEEDAGVVLLLDVMVVQNEIAE
jgi:hypothetical protein